MSHDSTLQLSLTDVAHLARVQRPVVSMWRRRELAGRPFPPPVSVVAGDERFDARQVADYLAATGRGNNPEARDDLAAHARLATVTGLDESVALDGLTTLITLATVTDVTLSELSHAGLLALAEQADPDDRLLLREVGALGDELSALAAHAEALADAAYSPQGAFEGLLRQHLQRALPGHAATTLQPAATALVAHVARALALDAGVDSPLIVDVTDTSGDLLLAVNELYAAELAPSVATLALDSKAARLTRRRLRVHDLHRVDVQVDADGNFAIAGDASGAIHVLQLPAAGLPTMTDVDVLNAIDNLVVQLDNQRRAVVIGPASALTDAPVTAEVDRVRDGILRTDRLRAVVRLPHGLLVRSPRQALGLWVIGAAHVDVARADRWTAIADLTDVPISEAVIDELVTDVVGAMKPDERSAKAGRPAELVNDDARQVQGHQFRHARRVRTTTLLPGRRALVDQPTAAARTVPSASIGAAIAALAESLSPAAIATLRVETRSRPEARATAPRTLGEAAAAGDVRILPGNRVEPVDITTGDQGAVVIGVDELTGVRHVVDRRIALLTFGGYPSGRLTEPGDVVFCTRPRAAAAVDPDGGSVVLTPARVLRLTASGLETFLPEVIAADLNALAANGGSSSWRRWPIRAVPTDQRDQLAKALAEIDCEHVEAKARLARLDRLAEALRDGVLSGGVVINLPDTHNTPETLAPPHSASADTPPELPTNQNLEKEG